MIEKGLLILFIVNAALVCLKQFIDALRAKMPNATEDKISGFLSKILEVSSKILSYMSANTQANPAPQAPQASDAQK